MVTAEVPELTAVADPVQALTVQNIVSDIEGLS